MFGFAILWVAAIMLHTHTSRFGRTHQQTSWRKTSRPPAVGWYADGRPYTYSGSVVLFCDKVNVGHIVSQMVQLSIYYSQSSIMVDAII